MIGKIKDVSWVTKIVLSREREHNIRSCFDVLVEFFYPQNVSEFNVIIENFQRKKQKKGNDDVLGENNIFDRLTVWTTFRALLTNQTNR